MNQATNLRVFVIAASACFAASVPIIASSMGTANEKHGSSVAQGQDASHRTSVENPAMGSGKMWQALFLAVDHRDQKEVQALLSKGADPNSRNGLYFTPLYIASASHQLGVMKALVSAGAAPDADSTYGNALTFASATAHLEGVQYLLSLGADVNNQRSDGISPLMMAANSGSPDVVAALMQHGAKVNEVDYNETSPLNYAARGGFDKSVELLLKAGAEVDVADLEGRTPLMAAAQNGHAEVVQRLLKAGAKPNLKDKGGRTALFLAAKYGDYPKVVKALLAGGADKSSTDLSGITAGAVAAERLHTASAALLGVKVKVDAASRTTPRKATASSLKLIQSSMLAFSKKVSCLSCHQEGLARMTTGAAKSHGFAINPELDKLQMQRIGGALEALKSLHQGALQSPEVMKQVPLIEINEVTPTYTWLLCGLAMNKYAPSDATSAMTMVLAKQQSSAGCWTFSLPRVPMQSSVSTFTALAVRSLKAYGSKSNATEVNSRIAAARRWLETAKSGNNEDAAAKLMGLKWAGATSTMLKQALLGVRKGQRADGGWSQLPGMESDAYATGQSLYAMHVAGVSSSDAAFMRGVKYLLRTQDADGSWYVNKRAIPANNYFDAGFPHGQSQYASLNGTCWATLALLEADAGK
ncbi:MAG: ankyrin repeat domain-containing protein [Fimbriimonadales bacterium]